MSFHDRTVLHQAETFHDGHWQSIRSEERWEGIDEAGKVCTSDATREALIESYAESYAFLMEQTEKYNIDWTKEGRNGPPLPLAGVRRVVRHETSSAWEEVGETEPAAAVVVTGAQENQK